MGNGYWIKMLDKEFDKFNVKIREIRGKTRRLNASFYLER